MRRHAAYIEQLVRQLDDDVDEGLRHAIPLGGLGPGSLSFRLPTRRADLRINPMPTGPGRSIAAGPTAHQVLHLAYRRAAERLEEAGRIDEAAFVWVELLNDTDRGVMILEQHGKYALAAQVAEMRQVAPAVLVRLWWRAGNVTRAIAIARRHDLFAEAVDHASDDPARARGLRTAWIVSKLRSGDFVGAVAVGWVDPTLRPVVAPFVRKGLPLGGPAGAAMQAYRLALDPSDVELDETRGWLRTLGTTEGENVRAFLVAFAGLRCEASIDREFASHLQRAVLRARWGPKDPAIRAPLRAVRNRADPILAADLPGRSEQGGGNRRLVAPRQPPGLASIKDAAALPSDQTLVALGERGCILLSASGRRGSLGRADGSTGPRGPRWRGAAPVGPW